MHTTLRLADVPVGAAGLIVAVTPGEHGQGRRLQDLGLIPGTAVRVERRAPLGDPTIYEVRHARLAMRRADALLIEVELVDPVGVAATDGGDDVAL